MVAGTGATAAEVKKRNNRQETVIKAENCSIVIAFFPI